MLCIKCTRIYYYQTKELKKFWGGLNPSSDLKTTPHLRVPPPQKISWLSVRRDFELRTVIQQTAVSVPGMALDAADFQSCSQQNVAISFHFFHFNLFINRTRITWNIKHALDNCECFSMFFSLRVRCPLPIAPISPSVSESVSSFSPSYLLNGWRYFHETDHS